MCTRQGPNFLGKNTGVGCHSFLQRIFPTQGSNSLPSEPSGKPCKVRAQLYFSLSKTIKPSYLQWFVMSSWTYIIHVALALTLHSVPLVNVSLVEQILFLLLYFAAYLNTWYGKFLFWGWLLMHRLFLYMNFRVIIFCSRKIQLKFSVLHVWINLGSN